LRIQLEEFLVKHIFLFEEFFFLGREFFLGILFVADAVGLILEAIAVDAFLTADHIGAKSEIGRIENISRVENFVGIDDARGLINVGTIVPYHHGIEHVTTFFFDLKTIQNILTITKWPDAKVTIFDPKTSRIYVV